MYSYSSHCPQPVGLLPARVIQLGARVVGGFPSPAEDLGAQRIDLTRILVQRPEATYVMRVSGSSMRDAGIDDGDTLVVDRSVKPAHGHVVVAVVDGDFTVKRLWRRGGAMRLQAANPTYPDITPRDGQTVEIWGVVRHCIKSFGA